MRYKFRMVAWPGRCVREPNRTALKTWSSWYLSLRITGQSKAVAGSGVFQDFLGPVHAHLFAPPAGDSHFALGTLGWSAKAARAAGICAGRVRESIAASGSILSHHF
jgi:hypothetical protein